MNTHSLFAIFLTFLTVFAHAEKTELTKIVEQLTPLEGTVPAQWRITWIGDGATEATISWSTAEKGEIHEVHYGIADEGTDVSKNIQKQVCQVNGEYDLGKSGVFYHHAVLKGLKPATRYNFVLRSDDEASRQFYFITAPEKGTGFSMLHGGDSRSGHLARCRVNMQIADTVENDPSIICFAHGGDYIVDGRIWNQWRLWLSQHELTTGDDGRVLPVIPTRGNHDPGPIYQEVFNIEQGSPDWYTTHLGRDVAMVTLDTNVPGGGAQREWLENELKELRPEKTWLLVQYHRPLYPAVKTAPPHTKIFTPLFDQYNVDLACESDGHCIKRTVPIRDGKADPTGVVYIGEGGLGVGARTPKANLWYFDGGMTGKGHHFMRLDFSAETLRVRTILLGGEVFDDVSLDVRD